MNENGYIRKIDELGRIVIPKGLRQRLRIQEGENLIVTCIDKNINVSKYSYIAINQNFIKKIGDLASSLFKYNIIITDLENIIYSNKPINNFELNSEVFNIFNDNENKKIEKIKINNEIMLNGNIYLAPIIVTSTTTGLIIVSSSNNEDLHKFSKFLAKVISTHIEVL